MSSPTHLIRDASGLESLLHAVAAGIADGHRAGAPLGLVGIRSRGVPLARRLAALLTERFGHDVPVGVVDITLYRDDFERKHRWPVLRGTDVPFAIEDAEIVLIDDVLHTGRTARAALNAICDLGRPACVRLAVLVDRGGRELPIQPDVVGVRVAAERDERVVVRLRPEDEIEQIVRVEGRART